MKVQLQKGVLFLIIAIVLLGLGVVSFANTIIHILWLSSQDIAYSLIKILLVRWLSILIFALFVTIFSFFHLLSSSKKERQNKRLLVVKTGAIFIFTLVAEYFLQISQLSLNFILGGFTGVIDPLTKLDMSFFLFGIPLLKNFSIFIIFYIVVLFCFRIPYYTKTSVPFLDKILILIGGFFTIVFLFITRMNDIYLNTTDYIGYLDIYGNLLPFTLSLICAFIFVSIVFLIPFKNKKILAIIGIGLFTLILGFNTIWFVYLEKFIYTPNQSFFQEQFAGLHAESTRRSFGLSNISRNQDLMITESEISNVLAKNFWQDEAHFLKVVQRNQEVLPIFNIYSTTPLLLSNQKGEFSPYFIASRESAENSNELWDVQHFRNIFGYGAIIGTANFFNDEGYPDFILKDLELNQKNISVPIKNPYIFFSEQSENYVFINTKMFLPNFKKENFPLEAQKFENINGISINFFIKTLLAIIYRDSRFFLTDYFLTDTKFIFKRKPKEIVQTILPNFHYSEPRLLYHNKELWWEMDIYGTSDAIYNSKLIDTPWGNYNWVKSSMKVFVSAYSGEIIFDILDKKDPFVRITQKLYPKLFEKKMNLSPEKYLYPIDLFNIQSSLLQVYHETNAASFYAGFNKREVALLDNKGDVEGTSLYQTKNKMILGKNKLAFQQTYTPIGKDIFSAELTAFIDYNKQQRLSLYETPASLGIPGLAQANAFLNQDPEFSRLSTLWGQIGSKLSSSEAIFYPMKDKGIYLSTMFLESETISTPLTAQFIVVDSTSISLGNTINGLIYNTLQKMDNVTDLEQSAEEELHSLIVEAYQYYLKAEAARLDGDAQEYQKNVDKIGVVLQNINKNF